MLPLAGDEFPGSAEELARAINEALARYFVLPQGRAGAVVDGDGLANLSSVVVNLDGGRVDAAQVPPKAIGVGNRERGPQVERFELSGRPIHYEKAKVNLWVEAAKLKFDFDRDGTGKPVLVLTAAREGNVEARIARQDLDCLVTEAATQLAKEQGVSVQSLDLDLQSSGPKSIAARVRMKAKKMFMTGVIQLAAQLDIDDQLNARVSHLQCSGEGVVGSTAAAIIQTKLKPLNGTTIPLMAFSLGGVALRDLKIALDGELQVRARFGTA